MGKPSGFMEFTRELPSKRPPGERVKDWKPFEHRLPEAALKTQGARCMDCGVPTCHANCPLSNLIPDFNDLVFRGRWDEALQRLHATNNFPEFTGLVCPAPCENSCTLGMETYEQPVTIKQLELAIIEKAWAQGGVQPRKASASSGKKVAVVGSGPSGLACAQQLARLGHAVTVFEKSDRLGGLLRYAIP
jgi:glutamate synthase (NADPH/NADH) small chain